MRAAMVLLVLGAVALVVLAVVAVADRTAEAPSSPTPRAAQVQPSPTQAPPVGRRRRLRVRCPADLSGCAAVRGRVVYVERVDPDGDGDLHVVVLAGHVTGPGITAVDVAARLRPRRNPRVGDLVAAAGPIQKGHLGQSQIHARLFRVARR